MLIALFSNNVSHQPQPDVPNFQKKHAVCYFDNSIAFSHFLKPDMFQSSVGLLKLLDDSSKADNFFCFHLRWWWCWWWWWQWWWLWSQYRSVNCLHPGVCICVSHLELCLMHIQILNLATIWLCPALHLRIILMMGLVLMVMMSVVMMRMIMVVLAMKATSPRNSSSSFSSCSAVTFPSSAYSPILFAGRAHTGDPFRYKLGSCK